MHLVFSSLLFFIRCKSLLPLCGLLVLLTLSFDKLKFFNFNVIPCNNFGYD